MSPTPPFPLFGELLALGSALGWAVAVVLFKLAAETRSDGRPGLGPVALNTFKNTVALVFLPPTMLLAGQSLWPDPTWADVGWLLLSGWLGMGLSDTFFLMALNRLGAASMAIVVTLYAPMVVLLAWLFLGESLGPGQLLGVGLVVAAQVLLRSEPKPASGSASAPASVATSDTPDASNRSRPDRGDFLVGFGFALVAMLSMAVSIILLKPVLERNPLLWSTEVRLAGGMLFLVMLIFRERHPLALFEPLRDPAVFRLMAPAAFIGTYLNLMLLLGGLKYALASVATVLNQLANLFIFLLAVIFLREQAGPRRWIGVALGVSGAVLVMLGLG